jgi:hypothetical protein
MATEKGGNEEVEGVYLKELGGAWGSLGEFEGAQGSLGELAVPCLLSVCDLFGD